MRGGDYNAVIHFGREWDGGIRAVLDSRPELSGVHYGLDATRDREWLLTDPRGAVAADAFALPERDGFVTTF